MSEPLQESLPVLTDAQKLYALALALKAIDDAYEELATFKAQIKSRVETLVKETRALRFEILSGQDRLPLEVSAEPAREQITEVIAETVKEINSGALNTATVKVTASMGDESNAEERSREKKRQRMRGQSAILPDPRPGTPPGAQP